CRATGDDAGVTPREGRAMVRLVLTHGRGLRGRDKGYLHRKFTRHLRQGLEAAGYRSLEDSEVNFIYYGDILDRAVQEAGDPLLEPVRVADAEAGATCDDEADGADLDAPQGRLDEAGAADTGVCAMVEERAGRDVSVSDETGAEDRRVAMDTAIDDRADQ